MPPFGNSISTGDALSEMGKNNVAVPYHTSLDQCIVVERPEWRLISDALFERIFLCTTPTKL